VTGTGTAKGPAAGPGAQDGAGRRPGASVVIGVGNPFRRDDGIGPAVAAGIARQHLPGVRVVISDGEPSGLIEAWSGAGLAVIVDALHGWPGPGRPGAAAPGRVHRVTAAELETGGHAGSSHGLGLPDAFRLARALGRQPGRAVILAVEAADVRAGPGLSPAVAAALPDVVAAVAAELRGAMVRPAAAGQAAGRPGVA
jgi:hydrogenase maturation protease